MNAPEKPETFRIVGTRPVRPDGIDKVTGKAIYGPDFVAPGMLHGAILRSPHPHARIVKIDTGKAEALPGVKAVATGADFPTLESLMMAMGESALDIRHLARNCMAHEKVLYDGHAVAAVAATTKEIAEKALGLIEVEYEVLPHVTSIEDAMREDAPILHDDVFTAGLEETPKIPSNVSLRVHMNTGDVDKALESAAAVTSGRYTTELVHQGYIEPHACVVSWNPDGQAQVWSSSQGAFMVRSLTAGILGLNLADVRATPLEIGGGFGGKTSVYLEPVAMVLSRKSGHPVRLTMSRTDIFRSSGPAPGSIVDIRMGAAEDGTLLGAEIEFKYHGGAYPSVSDTYSGMGSAVGHYKMANVRITGWNVLSNVPNTAAYRAPGAPQVNFAVESAIDELAQKLGLDPLEMRLKNTVRPGDPTMQGTPHGEIGYAECLEAAKAHPHWSAPLGPNQGRGVACGYWGNYGGPSTAAVTVADDGSVLVTEGNPDIGGSRAAIAMMAAETLQIPYDDVRVTVADTSSIGYSMLTGGSRTAFATGMAVTNAAKEVIDDMKRRAASMWDVAPDQVEWWDGAAHCVAEGQSGETLTIQQIAAKSGMSGGPIIAEVTVNSPDFLPGYGVHICDTEIDPETGHVSVKRYTAIQDVGKAIHPDYVEGQMQGGAVQGIGWALNEAYCFDKSGRVDNPGFLDYRMPVASDLPMIDTVMVEDRPNPAHPYGVKGVGETPIVPPLAAVGNSVSRASGIRMQSLPLTPDRVYAALQGKG